jgi:hypothetical protein
VVRHKVDALDLCRTSVALSWRRRINIGLYGRYFYVRDFEQGVDTHPVLLEEVTSYCLMYLPSSNGISAQG